MDFFILHLPVCVSDSLAGAKKKACDEIFHECNYYLDSELSLSGSSADYLIVHRKFLDAVCANWFARRRTHKTGKEREKNQWQLTSPLYTDYLKSFHSQHKKTHSPLSISLSWAPPLLFISSPKYEALNSPVGIEKYGRIKQPVSHTQALVSRCIEQVRLRAA